MKDLLFCLLVLLPNVLFSQEHNTTDTSFYKVIHLDSMWLRGADKRIELKDSSSYIELSGERAEIRIVTDNEDRFEKGRIYRLQETITGSDTIWKFYLVDRGAFRGSWTIVIAQKGSGYELQCMNAWSTYDRFFTGHTGRVEEIMRPVKKNYKPKANDRTVQ